MIDRFSFTVPGAPVPWARARRNGSRYFVKPQVADHARAIRGAWQAAGSPSIGGEPFALSVRFHLPRPTEHLGTGRNAGRVKPSAPTRPAVRPDLDNYVKLLLDALNEHAWQDDGQLVCFAGVHKLYADDGPPRTDLDVWTASSPIYR